MSGGNMANFVGFWAARAAARRAAGTCAPQGSRPRRARSRVYASGETHTWIQKAPTCPASAPTPCAGFRSTPSQRMDCRRAARGDRGRPRRGGRAVPRRRHARARSAPAPSIRCPRSPRCAASARPLVPRRRRLRRVRRRGCPTRRPLCAGSRSPTRWPSIPTSGSTRRSRPAARWCAIRRGCARVLLPSAVLPLRDEVDQLRRLRAAELARLPRAQGVAGAAPGRRRGLPPDDRATTSALARELAARVARHTASSRLTSQGL